MFIPLDWDTFRVEYQAWRVHGILPRDGGSEAQDPRFWDCVAYMETLIARQKKLIENGDAVSSLFGDNVAKGVKDI